MGNAGPAAFRRCPIHTGSLSLLPGPVTHRPGPSLCGSPEGRGRAYPFPAPQSRRSAPAPRLGWASLPGLRAVPRGTAVQQGQRSGLAQLGFSLLLLATWALTRGEPARPTALAPDPRPSPFSVSPDLRLHPFQGLTPQMRVSRPEPRTRGTRFGPHQGGRQRFSCSVSRGWAGFVRADTHLGL